MRSEYFALVISGVSLLVAGAALGWNIYRDIVLKPRVKVRFRVCVIAAEGVQRPPKKISISATNFGPGNVRLEMIDFKSGSLLARLFRKARYGSLIHDYKSPFGGKFPTTLKVGDRADWLFPFERDSILGQDITHIGVRDSFGRTHWAPKNSIRIARREWAQEYDR